MEHPGQTLNELLVSLGQSPLEREQTRRFEEYLAVFLRWNARMNLSAVRGEEEILSRHFVESIGCARSLPPGIATLLDFGSGGGFPGVPIAICRPEIEVTLAESQGKKASFLQEAVRASGLASRVHRGRAETLPGGFDCVTLRAVDQMEKAVTSASVLVGAAGWLALMTTSSDLESLKAAAGEQFSWRDAIVLPGSAERILALGNKGIS